MIIVKRKAIDFSKMSERVTVQEQNADSSYTDNITLWAHIEKDGFTRTENDNWFRVVVREHRALLSLLSVGNRLKWKDRILSIFSWQDLSYEKRGWIEIMAKQIVTSTNEIYGLVDNELFSDIVSVYRMSQVEVNRFGLISYEYTYDFNSPILTDIKCKFSTDRNRYLDDTRKDVEHDSLVVKFNKDIPIKDEDYIISPVHGKFKVDMIVRDESDMIQVYVVRSEVQ